MLLGDSLPVRLRQVSQCDVAAEQERVTIIVVPHVQRWPKLAGQLSHKAELAAVIAAAQAIEDRLFKLEPQVIVIPTDGLDEAFYSAAPYVQTQRRLGRVVTYVNEISNRMLVDGQKLITCSETGTSGDSPSANRRDPPGGFMMLPTARQGQPRSFISRWASSTTSSTLIAVVSMTTASRAGRRGETSRFSSILSRRRIDSNTAR